MDPAVLAAIIATVGTVFSGALVYAGVRYTQRQVSAANARTAELERSRVQNDGERVDLERIESMRAEIKDLGLQLKEQRADHHAAMTRMRLDHDAQIERMTRRIEDLEQKRTGDRVAIHTLTTYVRALLALLAQHGVTPPPVPDGLDV